MKFKYLALFILIIINIILKNYLVILNLPIIWFISNLSEKEKVKKIHKEFVTSSNTNLAIQESELELSSFFEKVYAPMCIVDRKEFIFIKVNKALCDMLGYSEFELLNNKLSKFIMEDDYKKTLDYSKSIYMENLESSYFINRYVCKNGDIINIKWRTSDVRKRIAYCLAEKI